MTDNIATYREVAIAAVREASVICRAVQQQLVSSQSMAKKDKSPVTIADYASQAVVCAKLTEMLSTDQAIVGEEDAASLRTAEGAGLCKMVVEQVQAVRNEPVDEQTVLQWIDMGAAAGDTERYWTLDPIDGTKGFLRKEQYAVALALIENGVVVLGLLGCPNLEGGQLLVAQQGKGTELLPLFDSDSTQGVLQSVSQITRTAEARFCESVESGHSDQDQSVAIAKRLAITQPPVRMDSQAKYATLAQGQSQIYLRLPTRVGYREKIWDHAAGMLVVQEAGGTVTDIVGKPLDFTHGRQLEENQGLIATNGPIHDQVVEAVEAIFTAP